MENKNTLSNLQSVKNIKGNKRLGRGLSSGKGQTSGRGTKGQKSRSGHNIPRSFEGGQTPLIQRLAKAKGFNSRTTKPAIVNVNLINKHFVDGEIVSYKTLVEKNLVKETRYGVKILGSGKLTKKVKIKDAKLTKNLLAEYQASYKPQPAKTVETKKTSVVSKVKKDVKPMVVSKSEKVVKKKVVTKTK